jgi:prepilin-type N-terminal cleavage/methylation domain-containing protein/prepilin-type processing-associated H-X9-DG protein
MTSSNQAPGNARPAFSLVELLVVVTVVGLALGFLLPALVRSREAANRVNCCNNLRQISLALVNYHEHARCLPPGVVDPAGPIHNESDGMHLGWVAQLLPYLEQWSVQELIDTSVSAYDPVNDTAAGKRLRSLRCPSDRSEPKPGGVGVSNYAGCHHDVEAPIDVTNHGLLYLNSSVRLDDVSDGTSHTLLVGEKMTGPADLGWLSGTRATLRNTGTPINRDLHAAGADDPEDDEHVGGFASRHPGGANIALGDGSVRFLNERIDGQVLRLLGHRDDGELLSADDF